jgi:hypothetical protein
MIIENEDKLKCIAKDCKDGIPDLNSEISD